MMQLVPTRFELRLRGAQVNPFINFAIHRGCQCQSIHGESEISQLSLDKPTSLCDRLLHENPTRKTLVKYTN